MANFINSNLIPPAINDERNRALVGVFGEELADFDRHDLLIQDAQTVHAALLPEMTIARAMTDFVTPGMREDLLRNLLDRSEEIHALSGTLPGIRRALAAIGLTVTWTQWFEEEPKGPHDTHKAKVFFEQSLADGYEIGDEWHRQAVLKLIDATKRWSQDTAISFGVQASATNHVGVIASTGGRYVAALPAEEPEPIPSKQFIAVTSSVGGTYQASLEV